MAPDTERLIATHSRFFALYDRVFSDAEKRPLTQDQQQHLQRPTEPLANEKLTQAAAPEPEIVVNNLISSDKGPAATLPEKPLIPRKRSREPSIAASSAAERTNDTEQAPPKRSVSELGDDEDEEGLVGARRHRRIVLHVKTPPQQQSSAAKEKQGSPAAIRVPPEDLSPPIKAIVQEDEKNGEKNDEKDNEEKGDEIVEPRTQYIVVASKPIPYAHQPLKRDRMANGSSAQPLRISSAGTAPRKRKLDIIDQLWSIKFQRRRGGSSSRRGSVRPGVALPCLPKNLARPAARAQLLRDARAAAAIPLSTVYPQIAEKINELVATNRAEPPKPTKD
ncbi:hypothetical protein DV452_005150 [Geotrichum candidum]|nr:hypothetical protein DV452_005150 [Geotrichum candidum]KAI9212441.1 hypothetical protein DS838_002648 [Geotrichum bryndzae]